MNVLLIAGAIFGLSQLILTTVDLGVKNKLLYSLVSSLSFLIVSSSLLG